MNIANFMSTFPHTLSPDHSMAAAHRLMQRHQIRHLPVIDNGKLVGVVSQRDLYFLESLTDMDSDSISVLEAMEGGVVTASPTDQVSQVARAMVDNRVGSVLVVEHGAVVGVFTTTDALQVLLDLATSQEAVPATQM